MEKQYVIVLLKTASLYTNIMEAKLKLHGHLECRLQHAAAAKASVGAETAARSTLPLPPADGWVRAWSQQLQGHGQLPLVFQHTSKCTWKERHLQASAQYHFHAGSLPPASPSLPTSRLPTEGARPHRGHAQEQLPGCAPTSPGNSVLMERDGKPRGLTHPGAATPAARTSTAVSPQPSSPQCPAKQERPLPRGW